MKVVLLVLCIGVALAVGVKNNIHLNNEYLSYCQQHNKQWTPAGQSTYEANVKKIHNHNANPHRTFSMGINRFTDMNEDQKRAYKGEYSSSGFGDTPVMSPGQLFVTDVPASWDWRTQGAVNAIKDQGQCGVCWAFASTSAVESASFIDLKRLVSLSESQQADCDTSGGCNECAFKWLQSNQPCTESSYSYQCPDSRGCRQCSPGAPAIKSYAVVPQSNETALKLAVFNRPVAIGIAASGDFMSYSSGIFTGSCPGGRDHAVVLVGYGSQNGMDFWILRNSWGTGWGENGYMRISRGRNGPDGICLIATDPSVPFFK